MSTRSDLRCGLTSIAAPETRFGRGASGILGAVGVCGAGCGGVCAAVCEGVLGDGAGGFCTLGFFVWTVLEMPKCRLPMILGWRI